MPQCHFCTGRVLWIWKLFSPIWYVFLSIRVWAFHFPKRSLFFLLDFPLHHGWSTSCGMLARYWKGRQCLRHLFLPLPLQRVSSVVLKRVVQSPGMLLDSSAALTTEQNDHWSQGCLQAGLWLHLPEVISICRHAMPLSPQNLFLKGSLEMGCTKTPEREHFYSDKAVARGQSHSLGRRNWGFTWL